MATMASARHDHSHGGDDECSSPHAMTFHAGVCQEILFSGWLTTTALQLAGSAALVFVAGVLYEGLKYLREALLAAGAPPRTSQLHIAKAECGAPGSCAQPAPVRQSMFSRSHALQTALHVLQTTCSYLLMLIFMTYNVWLCLALVLGLACGYFLFGWKKQTVVDVTEHCQ